MSVDGIGKGGPAGVQGVGAAADAKAVESSSPVDASGAAEAGQGVQGSEALQQLKAGQLSLDSYIDLQVTQATQHLRQAMLPQQLEIVTERLRLELRSDPALLHLVRMATGQTPSTDP